MQSKRARGATLRKVKTDAADAWHLAEMFYRGDLKPHREWDEAHTELQNVTRQHEIYNIIICAGQAKYSGFA
ncbi:transposase [Paenibacillus polymyxa]|uniref:IS110 family transposase n=1 Tax=Paenibacillus polymyxa TaxID=1406 RepID=UPI00307F7ECA